MGGRTDISSVLIIGTFLIGCSPELPITQDDLDRISDKCSLERDALVLDTPTRAKFQPDVEADHQAIDCALSEIRKISGLDFGFVGNEIYQTDENGDPIKEGDEGY